MDAVVYMDTVEKWTPDFNFILPLNGRGSLGFAFKTKLPFSGRGLPVNELNLPKMDAVGNGYDCKNGRQITNFASKWTR